MSAGVSAFRRAAAAICISVWSRFVDLSARCVHHSGEKPASRSLHEVRGPLACWPALLPTAPSEYRFRACCRYNDLRNIDKIARVQDQIRQVTSVMHENIEKVAQRGETLDVLVKKSQNLNEQAGKFERQSTALKKEMRCRNWKVRVGLFVRVRVCVRAPLHCPLHVCESAGS